MREPLKDRNRLEHILNAIDTILEKSNGLTYNDLITDKILFGGIVYYTMIIGEAAYHLSRPFKKRYNETNWVQITKMRHNLVHGYYQVDVDVVWSVMQDDLVPLREQVKRYLAETDWEEWEKNGLVIAETAVHKNLIQTASRMKTDGMDTKQISRYTGLTAEEIDEI
ncbi:MAG: DUF86 domain-containing protein [Bacteroidales bacterium]|nr:DUF86 domain-containing protein [Bacteroidales bacterium]MBR6930347.1 DUF86 domain-containing protein [Bacteroidales bacterium]